ncbi:hsp71-like protein [Suillus subaureus]|uniref:non-chaperonin molecular chaperone ATPase n=1 Tax=Suillus subaureus TaxID=48587 RepID=A0A9P7J7R4_9AGAM|nr:hsp71-like protein [Suillus subaureus]KAG1807000.1 hsp71-like protein [Suillus subaureus]
MITALGIDLGTSSCSVGVWKNDHVEIIANEHGNYTTPCCVSLVDNNCLIGEQAKGQAPSHPQNTIFNVKRFIGRKFDHLEVQSVMKYYPYDLIDKEGRPHISVEPHQGQQDFSAEEISSMILTKMKCLGETDLGAPCRDAVITVPAYFTDARRRATVNAARRAGLRVLRLLNDSTAASVAYTLADDTKEDVYRILVVGLGAGSLDVALVEIDEGVVEVVTVAGDCHLGGEDFDDRLVFHFVQEFWGQHNKGKEPVSDPRALWRLRAECERAKRTLSSATRADIAVEYLHDGIDFYSSITRVEFEALCGDLFDRVIDQVKKVLRNLDSTPVTEIILFGGSTHIPCIRTMISEIFDGKLPIKRLHPEAPAIGAAVMAAILSGLEELSPRLDKILVLDVASLSLGIQTAGGVMTRFIASSVTIPTKKSEEFTTYADNQSTLIFRVFEGDKEQAKDNNLLGIFELSDIPPAPRGVPRIEVTFDIDANNILIVTAYDQNTGKMKMLTVSERVGTFDHSSEVERMVFERKKTLKWYTSNIRSLISEDKLPRTLKASEKASLESVVKQAEEILDTTDKESPDVERYLKMQKILETASSSVLRKHAHSRGVVQAIRGG